MSLYSARLAGPTSIPGIAATALTVPSGHRYVVLSASFVAQGGVGTGIIQVSLGVAAAGTRILRTTGPLPDNTLLLSNLRWTFNAGESVQWSLITGPAGQSVTGSLHGYDLTD